MDQKQKDRFGWGDSEQVAIVSGMEELGGRGSGYSEGHRGRPGEKGGSLPRGSGSGYATERAIARTFSSAFGAGGITIKTTSGEEPKNGYVVAANEEIGVVIEDAKAKSRMVLKARIKEYIKKHRDLLKQEGYYLGLWYNKETGNLHIDTPVIITDKQKAIELGIEHDQIAIWDIAGKSEIPTGGSGKKGDQG